MARMLRSARHQSEQPVRRRLRASLIGGVALVGLLALLAFPLLSVPSDAGAARNALGAAAAALRAGDVSTARDQVETARAHVDDSQDSLHGWGSDVLSVVPWLGTPVDDARHLAQALDDATSIAEIGVRLYPSVSGKNATLFTGSKIDRPTLDRVIAGIREVGIELESADAEMAGVEGSTPFVGDRISASRDEAAAFLGPANDAYAGVEPMLDELPSFFGFDGPRTYLIAMLNPSELRHSGGAALEFAPMSWNDGTLELGASVSPIDDPALVTPVAWRQVRGNRFHRDETFLVNSTLAPSWSVSGEELLRAWQVTRDVRHDGMMAVDVVALAKLVGVSGELTVPGYGELTESNLVAKLVGSYDRYYPDATAQDSLNDALIPAFQAQLFGGGQYAEKALALGEAATGRHFSLYLRDDDLQAGFGALGLSGDLATPEGDYLSVSTQNTNIGKTDYWQRRRVALDVTLDEDGTATTRLDVAIDNDSPPYPFPEPDPRTGYFTRWAGLGIGVFLPDGVSVEEATVQGEPEDLPVRSFRDHDYVVPKVLLPPQGTADLTMRYQVADAATVEESGDLTYRLAVDPQGMVDAADLRVSVHVPEGYEAGALPEGWIADDDTLTFQTDAFEASETWEITLSPDN